MQWQAGEAAVATAIAAWLADPGAAASELMTESPRRILHRVDLAGVGADESERRCVVKRFRTASGRHPLREAVKRILRMSPARREWHSLARLHRAGLPVPLPLAWGRLLNGDELVVSEWQAGTSLRTALHGASPSEREALIERLAEPLAALHEAGFRHGDLHAGNVLVGPDRLFLLDLQRTRPAPGKRGQLVDLARLELSLARQGVSERDRRQLRDRLGVTHGFDPIFRRFLRDHVRGRSRRKLQIGRHWSRIRIEHAAGGKMAGMCEAGIEAQTVARWIRQADASEEAEIRRRSRTRLVAVVDGEQALVVKRTDAGSLTRALADRIRGSTSARAFTTGQRLAWIGPLAPRPLAFVEERRWGLPTRSWLVMETVGEQDLDRWQPESPQHAVECAVALGAWLAERHAWGLHHRDMKAGNLRIAGSPGGFRFWWVDLEDIRLGRRVRESERLQALAEINASLTDEAFPIEARHAALCCYASRLPFATDEAQVRNWIATHSVRRRHRWRGEGCVSGWTDTDGRPDAGRDGMGGTSREAARSWKRG